MSLHKHVVDPMSAGLGFHEDIAVALKASQNDKHGSFFVGNNWTHPWRVSETLDKASYL